MLTMLRSNGPGSPHQACAACKHQRRKCTSECLLAPFFPAEKTSTFLAVQKVFGVSNIVKLIKDLDHDKRELAINSMCWEAQWRLIEPIEGCFGEFRRMSEELWMYKNVFDPMSCSIKGYGGTVKPEIFNAFVYSNNNVNSNMVNNYNGAFTASNTNSNGGGGIVHESNQPLTAASHVYGFNKGNCGGDQPLYQSAAGDVNQQYSSRDHAGKLPQQRLNIYGSPTDGSPGVQNSCSRRSIPIFKLVTKGSQKHKKTIRSETFHKFIITWGRGSMKLIKDSNKSRSHISTVNGLQVVAQILQHMDEDKGDFDNLYRINNLISI